MDPKDWLIREEAQNILGDTAHDLFIKWYKDRMRMDPLLDEHYPFVKRLEIEWWSGLQRTPFGEHC